MLTLTVAEIVDLADAAGLVLNQKFMPDADEMEAEITIIDCPKEGVRDDEDKSTHYAHVAYLSDYPEEGIFPLGPELTPPNVELRCLRGFSRRSPQTQG
jgi:hypothetical protein